MICRKPCSDEQSHPPNDCDNTNEHSPRHNVNSIANGPNSSNRRRNSWLTSSEVLKPANSYVDTWLKSKSQYPNIHLTLTSYMVYSWNSLTCYTV